MSALRLFLVLVAFFSSFSITLTCARDPSPRLSIVAEIQPTNGNQITGIAVSRSGRIFVNFPRWNRPNAISVAEIFRAPSKMDSTFVHVVPYPNYLINQFDSSADKDTVQELVVDRFVCVQSVVIDAEDNLWVLDSGSPYISGTVSRDAPKLVKININSNEVVRIYHFDRVVVPETSYLNDVRIDEEKQVAYITDSKSKGAIIVVDLISGTARRLLDGISQVQYDPDFTAEIGTYRLKDQVNSDGIALSRDKKTLYFQALYANHLYSIETEYLLDESLSSSELQNLIVSHGVTTMTDGMEIDQKGRVYFTAIERFAITRCNFTGILSCEDIVQDPRIKWPDSFAWRNNDLYFTTSQIFLGKQFNNGTDLRTDPYRIWKITNAVKRKGLPKEDPASNSEMPAVKMT